MTRDVTLGERRTIASGRECIYLDCLLMDSNPLVIRKLLSNTHIRLQDILVFATRLTTTVDIFKEIHFHSRWFRCYEAREALLRNPYCDTGLTLKLLATMRMKTLRQMMFSGDLHPLIQESAQRLVRLQEEKTTP